MIIIDNKEYKTYNFDDIKGKCYGFIYITINKLNDKKYVGQHTKWRKNYLGSGGYLNRSIKKYGKDNFERFIIDLAYSQKELDEKETLYINEEWGNICKNRNWYNIKSGSQSGGNPYEGLDESQIIVINKKKSDSLKKAYKNSNLKMIATNNTRKNWTNPEYREKVTMSNKITYLDPSLRKKISDNNGMKNRKGKSHPKSKAIILSFPDGESKIFESITQASIFFGGTLASDPIGCAIFKMANGWQAKRGRWKGFKAEYIKIS